MRQGDEILALLFFFRQPQLLAIGVDRLDDDLRILLKVGSNDLLDGLDSAAFVLRAGDTITGDL